jgi:membrane protein DedA with SNARE-associated domain
MEFADFIGISIAVFLALYFSALLGFFGEDGQGHAKVVGKIFLLALVVICIAAALVECAGRICDCC